MAKNFSAAINEIMPLVADGDKSTPFIITRDSAYGDWQVCYPYPAENADSFFKSQREIDHLAVMFTGADFAKGSFAYVYDKVLYARLREEYYVARSSGLDTDELHAMTCFMQDHIGEFSHKATDFLTTLDRPVSALTEMCPYSMTTDNPDLSYDEDLAFDAIHFIENEVNDRLRTYTDERLPEPRYINGYEEKQSITIGKIEVVIAENLNADSPYLVCNRTNGEDYNYSAYTGYVQAMGEFLTRQTELFGVIKAEREQRGDYWLEPAMLTAAYCLPDSNKEYFTGKLLVVEPGEIMPEYRYADFQLVQCTHGNGARPDAIGTSVFCKELYSGESVVYGRHQILGIADESKLPKWAKVKLAEQRGDELPPAALSESKSQSEKPKHKPSLHDNLERNKARAARDNAARQDKPAKKRGDMEVE
ncbi:hypothetical protein FACS1894208_11320 [Clostridia bacterium]|nr:hypothetical protein FACS1894208_11320 [Clostridia bacterium]